MISKTIRDLTIVAALVAVGWAQALGPHITAEYRSQYEQFEASLRNA